MRYRYQYTTNGRWGRGVIASDFMEGDVRGHQQAGLSIFALRKLLKRSTPLGSGYNYRILEDLETGFEFRAPSLEDFRRYVSSPSQHTWNQARTQ